MQLSSNNNSKSSQKVPKKERIMWMINYLEEKVMFPSLEQIQEKFGISRGIAEKDLKHVIQTTTFDPTETFIELSIQLGILTLKNYKSSIEALTKAERNESRRMLEKSYATFLKIMQSLGQIVQERKKQV